MLLSYRFLSIIAVIILTVALVNPIQSTYNMKTNNYTREYLSFPNPWKLDNVIDSKNLSVYPISFDLINTSTGEGIGFLGKSTGNESIIKYVFVDRDGELDVGYTRLNTVIADVKRAEDNTIYGVGSNAITSKKVEIKIYRYDQVNKKWVFLHAYTVPRGYNNSLEIYTFKNSIIILWRYTFLNIKYTLITSLDTINFSILWSVTLNDYYEVARWKNYLLAISFRWDISKTTILKILCIDLRNGSVKEKYTIELSGVRRIGLFHVRDLGGYLSTVGYVVYGDRRIYLFNPVDKSWLVFTVFKPIYYIGECTHYGSYYAVLYGTREDNSLYWEFYVTDLLGHDKYIARSKTYYGIRDHVIAVTPNYVLVCQRITSNSSTLTTYSWKPLNEGRIRILSNIEAEVIVDNKSVGVLHGEYWFFFTVPPGRHYIVVRDNSTCFELYLNVSTEKDIVILNPLKLSNATVTVMTRNEEFVFYLDGKYIDVLKPGKKLILYLPSGKHCSRFISREYGSRKYAFLLKPNDNIVLVLPLREWLTRNAGKTVNNTYNWAVYQVVTILTIATLIVVTVIVMINKREKEKESSISMGP